MSAATPVLGSYVRDLFGRTGRVTDVHLTGTPEGAAWLSGQAYLTPEQKAESRWVSILCHGGGAVVQPASTVEVIDPFPFVNSWAADYFGEDA